MLTNAQLCHLPLVVAFEKKAARISEYFRLDQAKPSQPGIDTFHAEGFRRPCLAAIAVGNRRSRFSSTVRFFLNRCWKYIRFDRRSLPDKPPLVLAAFQSPGCKATPPSMTRAYPCRATPFPGP